MDAINQWQEIQQRQRELMPVLHRDGDRVWYTTKTLEELEREHGPLQSCRIVLAVDPACGPDRVIK